MIPKEDGQHRLFNIDMRYIILPANAGWLADCAER